MARPLISKLTLASAGLTAALTLLLGCDTADDVTFNTAPTSTAPTNTAPNLSAAPTPIPPPPPVTTSWTAWGGPTGDFIVNPGAPLAQTWPETGPPILWQRPLGSGYPSILFLDDTLYTPYRDGDEEVAIALDAGTGEPRWQQRRTPAFWDDMYKGFGLGPNSTPLLIDGTLVTLGIDGFLQSRSIDDGALRWQKSLVTEFGRQRREEEYGYSGKPLPYEGAIVTMVGGEEAAIVALEPSDGTLRWQSEPGGVSYAQPLITRLLDRDQYIYFEPEGLVALDPSSGVLLWRHGIEYNNGNHLTPAVVLDDHHVWIGSQFDTGGGRLLELREQDGSIAVQEVWFSPRHQTSHWTLIPRGDVIYGSFGGNRTSYLAALNWRDGKFLWRQRGFHKAQALWADDKLLFVDEKGKLALARVTPEEFELLGEAKLLESNAWTLPTLVGTTLYLRDQKTIMAVDLGG